MLAVDEEFESLTLNAIGSDASAEQIDVNAKNNGRGNHSKKYDYDYNYEEDAEDDDDDDDVGYTDYNQPNRFRTGRYSGYCTMSSPVSASPDSSDEEGDNDDDAKQKQKTQRKQSMGDDDNGEGDYDGDFVSFWSHKDSSSSSCCGGDDEEQTQPQHLQVDNNNNYESDDDDRVETTMRPMSLHLRKYQGGMHQSHDNNDSTNNPNSNNFGRNCRNFGSWFQRELGVANLHFEEEQVTSASEDIPRSRSRPTSGWGSRRRWGLGRRRPLSSDYFNDSDNDNSGDEEDDEEKEADTNSLLASSTEDDDGFGHIPTHFTREEDSPFDSRHHLSTNSNEDFSKHNNNNNIFGSRRNTRGGLLALPIVRPFLRGTRRGFTDDGPDTQKEMEEGGDEDENDIGGYAGDLPTRQDRAAVVQSISQGISGTNDDSLLLDSTSDNRARDADNNNQDGTSSRRNLLGRIFSTRFVQPPGHNWKEGSGSFSLILELHALMRKEDWLLATHLLESHPSLASSWTNITGLYSGRYDGEALPIHAACALRPPASFVRMLGELYPQGLREKDKAFGRVPLHVACRSLAESDVIGVLCELDASSVEERDTLKRVPLHYLIKNYYTLGDDDIDISTNIDTTDNDMAEEDENIDEADGIKAINILISVNPNCVHAADHRGWLPLHVACSCSSRKGMLRVISILLTAWPESVGEKTEKDSDVFDCVDMAGKVHPTKHRVVTLLKEAKHYGADGNDCDASIGGDASDSQSGEKKADGENNHGHGNDESDKCESSPKANNGDNLVPLDGDVLLDKIQRKKCDEASVLNSSVGNSVVEHDESSSASGCCDEDLICLNGDVVEPSAPLSPEKENDLEDGNGESDKCESSPKTSNGDNLIPLDGDVLFHDMQGNELMECVEASALNSCVGKSTVEQDESLSDFGCFGDDPLCSNGDEDGVGPAAPLLSENQIEQQQLQEHGKKADHDIASTGIDIISSDGGDVVSSVPPSSECKLSPGKHIEHHQSLQHWEGKDHSATATSLSSGGTHEPITAPCSDEEDTALSNV